MQQLPGKECLVESQEMPFLSVNDVLVHVHMHIACYSFVLDTTSSMKV